MANITIIPANERNTTRKQIEGYHYDRLSGLTGGAVSEEFAAKNPITEVYDGGVHQFTIHIVKDAMCAVKPRSPALRAVSEGGYLFLTHTDNASPKHFVDGDWLNIINA